MFVFDALSGTAADLSLAATLSVPYVAVMTVMYCSAYWSYQKQTLTSRITSKKLDALMMASNSAMFLFSLAGSIGTAPLAYELLAGKLSVSGVTTHPATTFWVGLYCVTKHWEFLETFALMAASKPVSFIHASHHVITVWYTTYATVVSLNLGALFAILNYWVHTVMYLYFLVCSIAPAYKKFGYVVTGCQLSQFALGLGLIVWFAADLQWLDLCLSFIMYSFYAVMFSREFLRRRQVFALKKCANNCLSLVIPLGDEGLILPNCVSCYAPLCQKCVLKTSGNPLKCDMCLTPFSDEELDDDFTEGEDEGKEAVIDPATPQPQTVHGLPSTMSAVLNDNCQGHICVHYLRQSGVILGGANDVFNNRKAFDVNTQHIFNFEKGCWVPASNFRMAVQHFFVYVSHGTYAGCRFKYHPATIDLEEALARLKSLQKPSPLYEQAGAIAELALASDKKRHVVNATGEASAAPVIFSGVSNYAPHGTLRRRFTTKELAEAAAKKRDAVSVTKEAKTTPS
jgi:hypothetical protein